MLKRKCLSRAVMAGALADGGYSSNVTVRERHSHTSGDYYQNRSCLRTAGGRKGIFLPIRTRDQAANQVLWRAAA